MESKVREINPRTQAFRSFVVDAKSPQEAIKSVPFSLGDDVSDDLQTLVVTGFATYRNKPAKNYIVDVFAMPPNKGDETPDWLRELTLRKAN